MIDYFIAFIIIVVAVFIWDWFEETKQKDKKHCSKEEISWSQSPN